jgi:lysyl-tRNA synthetase class I
MGWKGKLRPYDYLCPKCGEAPTEIDPLDSVTLTVTCNNGHTWTSWAVKW